MKKTLAALLAFICIAGGTKLASYSPVEFGSNTNITASAADDDSVGGVHAKDYKYAYADTSVYPVTTENVDFKMGESKDKLYTWVDKTDGNTYGFIKTSMTVKDDKGKDVVQTKLMLALCSVKSTNLDVTVTKEIEIPEITISSSQVKLFSDFVSKGKGTISDSYVIKGCKGTVTAIADSAFKSSYVKSVDLKNIEYIGPKAFYDCKYVIEVTIPDSVHYLGESVFEGSGLKILTVNNEMVNVPKKMCANTKLTDIKFAHPDYIRSIGQGSFSGTPLSAPFFNSWTDVSKYEPDVRVEKEAFKDCTSMKSIVCPDNITYFGISSFDGCTGVQSIKFGKKLQDCDQYSFRGCSALTDITFNSVVRSLAGGCFQGCVSLKKVTGMPKSLIDWTPEDKEKGMGVGDGVFADCSSLQEVVIPNSLQRISPKMFENCIKLTKVQFGNPGDTPTDTSTEILKIKEGAFRGCTALESVNHFPKAETIEKEAFKNCTGVKSVSLPAAADIGESAFSDCTSVTTVSIPASKMIRARAFKNCTAMTSFKAGECLFVGNNALENCSAMTEITLLAMQYGGDENNDPGKTNSNNGYVFKDCIKAKKINIQTANAVKLSSGMFMGCTALKEIGGDVKEISVIGKECFSGCTALEKLNLPALRITEASAFQDCTSLVSISDSGNAIKCEDYGDKCFLNCSKLGIAVSGDISTIGASAFENSAVKSVTLNGMVGGTIVIGDSAFANCPLLESAVIRSEGVQKFSVGSSIFKKCEKLGSAVYEGPIITSNMFADCTALASVETSADIFDNKAFQNCLKLTQVNKIGTKDPVIAKNINTNAFENCAALVNSSADMDTAFKGSSHYAGCKALKSASVAVLTSNMFRDCESLTDIKISSDVKQIPEYCFANDVNLAKFDFTNINKIDSAAFQNTGFTALDLTIYDADTKVGVVGSSAFNGCQKLASVKIVAPEVGSSAFADCPVLKAATLKTNKVLSSTFTNDIMLENVIFESDDDITLKSVGNAFGKCSGLKSVTINGNPTISDKAVGYVNSQLIPGLVIWGHKGTSAETYAAANKIDFGDLDTKTIVKNEVTTTTKATTTKATTTTTAKPVSGTSTTKIIPLTTTTVGKTLPVTTYGDANCDKSVDLSDAVLIMQSIANPDKFGLSGSDKNHITEQGQANADVKGGGDGVTTNDALTIQKYKLGLVKALPEQ